MDSQKRSLGFLSLAFLFITCSSAEFLIHQVLTIRKKQIQVTEGRETENNSSYSLQSNLGKLVV
ncbi:hypothetical protein F2Q69_00056232 [Brassica cretica]|uniref:Uncharacterized protein n=1 Tax=Brassica cretica TaxID=69181 RepID=A0A8S9MMH0_BRACR|nr:hypothetical protein F2Q69_00056232 [Brassica cretica]